VAAGAASRPPGTQAQEDSPDEGGRDPGDRIGAELIRPEGWDQLRPELSRNSEERNDPRTIPATSITSQSTTGSNFR